MTAKKKIFDLPALTDEEKFIHEPSRLMIMSILYVVDKVDYLFLKNHLKMTFGNLSSHLNKLESKEYEYITVEKKFIGKKPYTILKISEKGKIAYENYRKKIKKITSI